MKILIALLFFCTIAFGQVTTLPQLWVNSYEADKLYTYELSLPSTWIAGPVSGCTFHTPYWSGTPTSAGLQSAVNDIEACRTATGVGIKLDIPPALYSYSTTSGLLIPQTNTSSSTNFLILSSTQDANLPNGQIVCSHGMQDNLTTSSDIGLDNPDCAGDAMYYQLGTTITNISPGAFTLASGIHTNTSAYNDVQYMYTLETTGVNASALTFCNATSTQAPFCTTNIGPDHWLIEDVEIRKAPGVTSSSNVISVTGGGVGVATALSQYASHIHFRKVWEHGDWTTLLAGTNQITTGAQFSCSYCSIVDSQFSQNLRPGAEGHTISPNGPGPYKFVHNWLEGSSSCIFAGGNEGVVPFGIPTLVTFQDVEIRKNRCTFPYSWLGVLRIPPGNTTWNNQALTRKNMEEFKNGDRVLLDGNIFEDSDNSGGQSGVEFDINLKNWLVNYELSMTDITFTNNIIRNSCEGFEQEGTGNSSGNGTGNAYAQNRTIYANNLFYNVSALNPGCTGVNATNDTITAPAFQWQGTVTMNSNGTATFVGNCSAASVANGGTVSTCPGSLQSVTVNTGGSCSVNGSLTIDAPSQGGRQATGTYTCSGGAIVSTAVTNQGSLYLTAPNVTAGATGATLTAVLVTSATNPPQGAEAMDLVVGDSVAIFGCQNVSAFNQTLRNLGSGGGFWPTGLGPTVTTGSIPFNGSFSTSNITISYAWSGVTPGTVDNSGYCTLSQLSGSPANFNFVHNTVISDSQQFFTSGAAKSLPPYAKNTLFSNSIFMAGTGGGTNGWYMSVAPSPQEGTNTEAYNHDINSLTVDSNVFPGRTGSLYTAYGNNPNFPVASPILYFPASAANVGFICSGCSSAVSLALSDYHGYALALTSPYHNAARDGSDIGANITAIDTSQTQNLYVCATTCGSGPFPDPPLSATYYIAAIGSDSNNGTSKSTPWLHAPGMKNATGIAASTTINPGDSIIFRGGDTWHFGNSGATPYVGACTLQGTICWEWQTSGVSNNPIYIGVDTSWFAGGSWVRPIMSGDNALTTSFVGSCSFDQSNVQFIKLNQVGYVRIDNLDWQGGCISSTSVGGAYIFNYQTNNVLLENNYFHGLTAIVTAQDAFSSILGNGTGVFGLSTNNQIVNNTFDYSDSSNGVGGSGACSAGFAPSEPCYMGTGVYSEGFDIHDNYFGHMSNMIVINNASTVHDNLFEYLYTSFSPSAIAPHSNVINEVGNIPGASTYFYNNTIRHTYASQAMYITTGANAYVFNNIVYDTLKYGTAGGSAAPTNCIILGTVSNTGSEVLYFYNNTIDYHLGTTGGGCNVTFSNTNSPNAAWNGTANFENNHFIDFSPVLLSSVYHINAGASSTIHDLGNEIFQTETVANSQGYTTTNDYAPTLLTNSTVFAGSNLSASCISISPALCLGTTDGVVEQSGSGGKIASFPTISPTQRIIWDAGAWQFSAKYNSPVNSVILLN